MPIHPTSSPASDLDGYPWDDIGPASGFFGTPPPCPRCHGSGTLTEDPLPGCPAFGGYEERECEGCEGTGEDMSEKGLSR